MGRLLLLSVQDMKKYSMLAAGIMIILANISGLFLAVYYKPLAGGLLSHYDSRTMD
jgi:hypothetical protein